MKKCLFIGTFDPFHNGHLSLVKQLSQEYDIVYVFITKNYLKINVRMFTCKEMYNAINEVLKECNITNVKCVQKSHFIPCSYISKLLQCKIFCRGLKERDIKQEYILQKIHNLFGIKTVFYSSLNYSSRGIKSKFLKGEDISNCVPKPIYNLFKEKKEYLRI